MILSWLAFCAMSPVIERLGPTALVYPALRGNPLLDLWLGDNERLGNKVPLPDVRRRLTPSLPHRFLAIVPWGSDGSAARELADKCEAAFKAAWRKMAEAVRTRLKQHPSASCQDWDKRWEAQINSYFSVSTAVVPLAGAGNEIDRRLSELLAGKPSFAEAFPNAEAVRKLARAIPQNDRPDYDQDHAGRWQYQVELVHRILAARRAIRYVPVACPHDPNDRYPQKCTLLGTFEQMGPDDLAESKQFWDRIADPQNGLSIDGVRIRKGEALCAVALVKRFCGPAFVAHKLDVKPAELRFPDTWTVAAAEWLKEAGIDWQADHTDGDGKRVPWNGQWLHWSKPDEEPDDADPCPESLWKQIQEARRPEKFGRPPAYYAILKLDGDDLGGWLRGEKSPKIREVMHPSLVDYYEGLGGAAKDALDAKRPVGPALHAAISTALANFALHAVPEIVTRHHGTVIYSGGDDTLVLLPVSTALACALELRRVYMCDWWRPDGQEGHPQSQREYLMMGSRATLSGGLVIVHAKDDLRLALQDVRSAEKQAKEAGKDALVIVIRRRSGEHTSALCPWDFVETIKNWRQQFSEGASDRWAYHLKAEEHTLAGLESAAVIAEIRRQVNRAETRTRRLLGEPVRPNKGETAGDILASSFEEYRSNVMEERHITLPRALSEWLTLCHTASFMARGRDE